LLLRAYNEFDDIPAHVHPLFYEALNDWGFDGFVIGDDTGKTSYPHSSQFDENNSSSTGMSELFSVHRVAESPADAIRQWFDAGGMIQFYDYPLEIYLNVRHPTPTYVVLLE